MSSSYLIFKRRAKLSEAVVYRCAPERQRLARKLPPLFWSANGNFSVSLIEMLPVPSRPLPAGPKSANSRS